MTNPFRPPRLPFPNCRCVLPRPEEGDAYRRAIVGIDFARDERGDRTAVVVTRLSEPARRALAGRAVYERERIERAALGLPPAMSADRLGRNPVEEFAPANEADAVLERALESRGRFAGIRTVRTSAHLNCPNAGSPERLPLVIRCDADRTRRCLSCSRVWLEVELMAAARLEDVEVAVVTIPEIEWIAAMGEAERRFPLRRHYGEEPEIPAEAEALDAPSSRLPMYRPR